MFGDDVLTSDVILKHDPLAGRPGEWAGSGASHLTIESRGRS
jgi:hypothetical protein